MKIKICNYEIMNFDNENLITSEQDISKTTSSSLLSALNEIKLRDTLILDQSDLDDIFRRHELPGETATDFLKSTINITEAPKTPFLKKLRLSMTRLTKAK